MSIKIMLGRFKHKLFGKDEPVEVVKERAELNYWLGRKQIEEELVNSHYHFFYTEHFGLTDDFYKGKNVLDIGCGPRGSLEWADMAADRVGLDPLADEYLKLGADRHKMRYVKSGSEEMPFEDGFFDVVCSFNSLDHVGNLDSTIKEITRILKPGGLFLLLADIHAEPTVCEPQVIEWNFLDRLKGNFTVALEEHLEKHKSSGMYESIKPKKMFDHNDPSDRYGIISARLVKK